MKILVTGATGNVGSYVVSELIKLGEQVIAAGTEIKRLRNHFNEEVEVVEFDFMKPDTYQRALKDVDRVFLMRPPHIGKPKDLYPFIDALKKSNIKLVSFLSLMGIEKNTIPPHYKIEKYIEKSGLPYAHIRPGFFMQNLSGIHSVEIKEQEQIFIPAGRSKVSFIDTADIGYATAAILHQPDIYKNTAHTITGPEALDYYQVAEILSKICKRKIAYRNPGFLKYRRTYIKDRGLDKAYVNVTMALYLITRMGNAKEVTDTYKKITGKAPKTFEQFATENRAAFTQKCT